MGFPPKGKRYGGRKKGTPNKLTKSVKEAFDYAFRNLQGDPKTNLLNWAKRNTTEFYKIAARLIPTEINAQVSIQETAIDLMKRGKEIVEQRDDSGEGTGSTTPSLH